MGNTPGLLGTKPSRHFKIFREADPAIFRFDGKLYMEHFDLDRNAYEFVEVSEDVAAFWTRPDAPSLRTTAEATTTVTPSQENANDSEEIIEDLLTEARRHYWEGRFDQGYHGHAEGNKERWVNKKLQEEGYL